MLKQLIFNLETDLDSYLKSNSEDLSIQDIDYFKTIFKIFQKEKEFSDVLNKCKVYLYRLGTWQEINDSFRKKEILDNSLRLGWINLILRQNVMFLLKIEEKS